MVKVGPPKAHAHREAIYNLFLPEHLDTCTEVGEGIGQTKSQSKSNVLTRRRQRAILNFFLNGAIDEPTIVHWSQCFVNKETVLAGMKKHLVPALISQSLSCVTSWKWLGCENTFRWIGLLLSHHNLLVRVVREWLGRKKTSDTDVLPATVSVTDGCHLVGLIWRLLSGTGGLRLLQVPISIIIRKNMTTQHPVKISTILALTWNPLKSMTIYSYASPVQDPATGDINWSEANKASLRKAQAWLNTSPGTIVVTMTVLWEPILRLMRSLLYLGSNQWEQDQEVRASNGEERTYRVIELFARNHLNKFNADLGELFHQPCHALPTSAWTVKTRTLMLRLLCRCGSATHQVFGLETKLPPYTLLERFGV